MVDVAREAVWVSEPCRVSSIRSRTCGRSSSSGSMRRLPPWRISPTNARVSFDGASAAPSGPLSAESPASTLSSVRSSGRRGATIWWCSRPRPRMTRDSRSRSWWRCAGAASTAWSSSQRPPATTTSSRSWRRATGASTQELRPISKSWWDGAGPCAQAGRAAQNRNLARISHAI